MKQIKMDTFDKQKMSTFGIMLRILKGEYYQPRNGGASRQI